MNAHRYQSIAREAGKTALRIITPMIGKNYVSQGWKGQLQQAHLILQKAETLLGDEDFPEFEATVYFHLLDAIFYAAIMSQKKWVSRKAIVSMELALQRLLNPSLSKTPEFSAN